MYIVLFLLYIDLIEILTSIGDGNYPDNDISTESYDRSSIPDKDIGTESPGRSSIPEEDISTESAGGPNYAAIAGGIVGGVLLIICIIVGVFLLRRRNCIASGKEQVMTNLNPTYDPTHSQPEPEQAHLMNSPNAIYILTSHVVDVDNAENEVSNT